ncbi:macro domain-containing protein [candidate division FCPU426 bacterium]|nr:macro domain-containing protein [candidate division FCPU426 bacterium]
MTLLINNTRVEVAVGELAFQAVDALIHPTNNYLWFSSGIAEGLKRRGGEELEEKALALGPIDIGQAVITDGGRLKAKAIIHAAAWAQDMMTQEKTVHRALASALNLARGYNCQTVALPVLGFCTGGFSQPRAIETVFLTVVEHCMQATTLIKILLMVSNKAEEEILNHILKTAKAADPPKGEDA